MKARRYIIVFLLMASLNTYGMPSFAEVTSNPSAKSKIFPKLKWPLVGATCLGALTALWFSFEVGVRELHNHQFQTRNQDSGLVANRPTIWNRTLSADWSLSASGFDLARQTLEDHPRKFKSVGISLMDSTTPDPAMLPPDRTTPAFKAAVAEQPQQSGTTHSTFCLSLAVSDRHGTSKYGVFTHLIRTGLDNKGAFSAIVAFDQSRADPRTRVFLIPMVLPHRQHGLPSLLTITPQIAVLGAGNASLGYARGLQEKWHGHERKNSGRGYFAIIIDTLGIDGEPSRYSYNDPDTRYLLYAPADYHLMAWFESGSHAPFWGSSGGAAMVAGLVADMTAVLENLGFLDTYDILLRTSIPMKDSAGKIHPQINALRAILACLKLYELGWNDLADTKARTQLLEKVLKTDVPQMLPPPGLDPIALTNFRYLQNPTAEKARAVADAYNEVGLIRNALLYETAARSLK